MVATNPEELGDDLDANLQWRRTELLAMKRDIENLKASDEWTPRGRALRRAGHALLYAHWEGYTKVACQAYLDYVAKRRLTFADLNDAFVSTSLARLAAGADKPSSMERLLKIAREGPAYRPQLPRDGIVNTRSNLRYEVLEEICVALGLPISVFETKSKLINLTLCDVRNEIAHGQDSCPSRDDFLSLHDEIISMIDSLRELILKAAASGSYRS